MLMRTLHGRRNQRKKSAEKNNSTGIVATSSIKICRVSQGPEQSILSGFVYLYNFIVFEILENRARSY